MSIGMILAYIKYLPAVIELVVNAAKATAHGIQLIHQFTQTGETHKKPVISPVAAVHVSTVQPAKSPPADAVAATATAEQAENDIINSDSFQRIEKGE